MSSYSDLEVHQGEDIVFRIELVDANSAPKDLEGLESRAYFRKSYTSTATTYQLTPSFIEPRTLGILDLTLLGQTSDDIPRGRYFYDVFLLNQDSDESDGLFGISEKILEGQIEVMPSVTSIT
jgi:hypothetical protein